MPVGRLIIVDKEMQWEIFPVRPPLNAFVPGFFPSQLSHSATYCTLIQLGTRTNLKIQIGKNLKNRLSISMTNQTSEITLLARWFFLKFENVNILREGELCFLGRSNSENIGRKYGIRTKVLKSVSPPWGHEREMTVKISITFTCKKYENIYINRFLATKE